MAWSALEVIGLIGIIYLVCVLALQSLKCINVYFIRAARRKNCLSKESSRWALVTGATDGIGKGYAHALAKRGFKIILVSRNPRKLSTCASEITEKYKVETKIVAVDFTHDEEIYEVIKNAVAGLEIGVLINNVGISYGYPELFLDIPEREKTITALIRANIVSVPKMCEIVLPQMVQRKSGVIVNVSSLSALFPSPFLCLYAASKSFVEKFSDDLRVEYENKGIVVQTLLPGYVATNMSKIRKSTWMAPSPDKYVASALAKVGVNDHTTGYFAHALMVSGIHSILAICRPLGNKILYDTLKNIRNKALSAKGKQETTATTQS